MAVYMLVTMTLQEDQRWREEYRKVVPDMIRSFGGEYCIRSNDNPVIGLESDGPVPDRIAIVRFPSMEAAWGFVERPDYQPYRDARKAATTTTILAFESDD